MNSKLKNLIGIYSTKQYRAVIFLTVIVLILSSFGVYQVLKNHKEDLRKEVYAKSKFILLSIEEKVAVNILINDYKALKELERSLQRHDSSILGVSFYDNQGKWLYGKRKSIQFPQRKWGFHSRDGKILTSYKYSKGDSNLYLQVVISEASLEAEVKTLRDNSILFIIVLVISLNTALFKKFYDLEISIQKEAKAKSEAEVSIKKERIQRHFLANMSHELRTPLNAIIGFTKLLSETNDEKELKDYIKILLKSSDHMKNLINDILDLSKIQEGKLELDTAPFEITNLYNSVLEILEHRLPDSVYLKSDIKSDKNFVLSGDALRLRQVMINLLGNAMKYTKEGSINAELTIKSIGDKCKIIYKVIDTGIGIPEAANDDLFNEFFQAHSSSLQIEGTGLGLAISKKIIDLFEGVIGYSPNPEGGSIFYFEIELPIAESLEEKIDEDICVDFSKYKVLVAEDNEFNSILVETLLKKNKFKEIDMVSNGVKAVEKAEKKQYDLILMDIQMPVMGGVEALKIIKKSLVEIPVIALTANAIKGDGDFFLAQGFDGYVSKPIDESSLVMQMMNLLGSNKVKEDVRSIKNTYDIFNAKRILEHVGGNERILKKLLLSFRETIQLDLNSIESKIELQEFEKVKRIAHKIKPSIDILLSTNSKNLIRIIENKEGSMSSEEVKSAYNSLTNDISIFLNEARNWIDSASSDAN